uniref:ZAD domain-containing protein n=1 Tax=Anopheles dirus TaxID=7168 RepID=A0A182NEP5_9DIPT
MSIKHCRICYGPDNDDLISVQLVQDGVTIHEMILTIAGISVTGDRRLPQNICLQCLDRLKIAFELRRQCISTHGRLCEQLGSPEKDASSLEGELSVLEEKTGEELQTLHIARLEEEFDEPKSDSDYEREQIEYVAIEKQHIEPWREDVHFVSVQSFPCCGCSMRFDTRYELKVHSVQVHRKGRSRTKFGSFLCTICYQSHTDQSSLDHHLKLAGVSTTMYECLHCLELFADRKELCVHLEQQNKNPPIELVEDEEMSEMEEGSLAPSTSQEVKTDQPMSEHEEEYLLLSDSAAGEDECSIDISASEEASVEQDEEAWEESYVKSHPTDTHGERTHLQRAMCRIPEKNLHIVSDEQTYLIVELLGQRCCCCAQLFNTENQLNTHLNKQRSIAQPDPYARYTCEYCGKPFKYSLSFVCHKRLREQRQFYLCRLCNTLLDSGTRMLSHMLMSEEHANFFKITRENISDRYETVALPGRRCCSCKQYFEDMDGLLAHVHSAGHRSAQGAPQGAGRFGCEVCKRTFRSESLVARHLRYTMDVTQYYCKLCDFETYHLRRMELHLYGSIHRETVLPMLGVQLKALEIRPSSVPPVRYCCFDKCKIPFQELAALKQHAEAEHPDELSENRARAERLGKALPPKRYHECDVCALFFQNANPIVVGVDRVEPGVCPKARPEAKRAATGTALARLILCDVLAAVVLFVKLQLFAIVEALLAEPTPVAEAACDGVQREARLIDEAFVAHGALVWFGGADDTVTVVCRQRVFLQVGLGLEG